MKQRKLVSAALVLLTASVICAEDWPMRLHDMYGTGETPDKLTLPLVKCWEYHTALSQEPIKPLLASPEPHGRQFACRVIAAEGKVFAGLPDHRLICLDAATGRLLWSFMTDGPIRVSPAYHDGVVIVGNDEGKLYGLEAKTGRKLWKFSAAPTERHMIGYGKMISSWPIRAGLAVCDGKVYFAAGIFANDGVFLYCVDAKTGEEVWSNGQRSEDPFSHLSPSLLRMSRTHIAVVNGLAKYALFKTNTGQFVSTPRGNEIYTRGFTLVVDKKPDGEEPMTVLMKGRPKATANNMVVPVRREWTIPPVKAGSVSISGGGKLLASVGRKNYSAEIVGGAVDMAVTDGRLFVGSGKGVIYCFGSQGMGARGVVKEPVSKDPYAGSEHTALIRKAVDAAVSEAIFKDKGCALLLDCLTGQAALEIAKKTDMRVFAVSGDAQAVAAAREKLLQSGLYGSRVALRHCPDGKAPYPPYFADIILSEAAINQWRPARWSRFGRDAPNAQADQRCCDGRLAGKAHGRGRQGLAGGPQAAWCGGDNHRRGLGEDSSAGGSRLWRMDASVR
ncbi:MAG: outer membrane protein assembly factor BamB family protein [Planctomycetota bacterium]|jgi:outer membrane protein assembly factor BamB